MWSRAEMEAWQRDPETVRRMAEIERWAAEQREREWEEGEAAKRRLQLEREDQERREQQQRDRDRARAERERQRAERAKHYNLLIRPVRYERSGGHDYWRTDHRTKRMVHGIASTPTITSNACSRSSAGCRVDFPIPLLVSHEEEGSIGEVVMLRRSPREVYIVAALHDGNLAADYAWSLVEQGELRAFSVASAPSTPHRIDGAVLGTRFVGEWTLGEVSLCRQGANPDCRAEIFSSRRKFP
jgi:hypothetical protein